MMEIAAGYQPSTDDQGRDLGEQSIDVKRNYVVEKQKGNEDEYENGPYATRGRRGTKPGCSEQQEAHWK